jgi:hypothetical protein
MRDTIEMVVKALVDDSEAVDVREIDRNGTTRIEVRVAQPRARRGRYRFGAIGKYYRWPVVGDGLGNRVTRCMNPGSRRPIKCR